MPDSMHTPVSAGPALQDSRRVQQLQEAMRHQIQIGVFYIPAEVRNRSLLAACADVQRSVASESFGFLGLNENQGKP